MKRQHLTQLIGTLVVAGALVVLPTVAFGTIVGSKHDFSLLAWDTEICNACHTPHNADTTVTDAPLWDHQVSTQTFIPYPSGGTMQSTPGAPSGVSLLCLSCHDGVTAMDNYGGVTTGTTTMGAVPGNFGLDLSNDHPISMTYDDALAGSDGELYAPTSTLSGLGGNINVDMLFGTGNDKVECASCHDPHGGVVSTPFLRKDNAASALCLTCHNK